LTLQQANFHGFGRNAGFIRQVCNRRAWLPDKPGVPMVVSRRDPQFVTAANL
jgi:hypothetical protein